MEIILFKDKSGMCKCETTQIHGTHIMFKFIGAPAYSIATFVGERKALRSSLSLTGECEVDVSQLLGDVKISVSHKGDIWKCDGIRVEKDDVETLRISSLANYPEKFGRLLDEINDLKSKIERVSSENAKILKEIESAKKDYNIV